MVWFVFVWWFLFFAGCLVVVERYLVFSFLLLAGCAGCLRKSGEGALVCCAGLVSLCVEVIFGCLSLRRGLFSLLGSHWCVCAGFLRGFLCGW